MEGFNLCVKINYKFLLCILVAIILTIFYAVANQALSTSAPISAEYSYELPVLMYHHIMESGGQLGAYCITPTEFENDLKYLKENGYNSIVVADLIDYCYSGKPLPQKPVMITFDDGYQSNYVYAYPLLKEYNMRAVVSIIGRYADLYSESDDHSVRYAHMTWEELAEISKAGVFEIQNHSYNCHSQNSARKGIRKLSSESDEQYATFLQEDLGKLQIRMQEMLGYSATAFAFPFGASSKSSHQILKDMGFYATFSSAEGLNYLTGNPEELYKIKRFNRPHNITTETFFGKVYAKAKR